MNKKFSNGMKLGLFCAALPAIAFAGPHVIRTVLPCILDLTPQEGELAADFANNTVWFKIGGVLRDLTQETNRSKIRFPEIIETAQSVQIKTAGFSVTFSDGNAYSFFSDTTLDRVQYSYGIGGAPALQAGWVNAFAVPAGTNTGNAAIAYQMDGTTSTLGHDGMSRYLGSFYLQANTACAGDECSATPSLPANCLNYSSPGSCPSAYGRLMGVTLHKMNERYEYSITPVVTTTPIADEYQIQNLNSYMDKVRFFSAQEVEIEAGFPVTVTSSSAWVPVYGASAHLNGDAGSVGAVRILGHTEAAELYE